VEIVERIRGVQHFATVAGLIEAIREDERQGRRILGC
jgi:FAD synthase